MIIIGENIHIISNDVSTAIKSRDAKAIQALAMAQSQAGAHYIDLNLGPATKDPIAMTEWLVKTVQAAVDLPLSIDTLSPVAMDVGLKMCKRRPLLNSISGKAYSQEHMLPLAKKYSAELVVSVLTDKGCPMDVASRSESIMETVAHVNRLGIPNEDIWVDPILLPVSADQSQAKEVMEFIKILPDILPGVKSTLGLSNLSNGTPPQLRGMLNRTYMIMLGRCGQYSVIADALDRQLMALNRGEMPEIIKLVYQVMDGESVDMAPLPADARDYVKTAKVLTGEKLYSHSWLED
jgi:5-methyltetrahydrofolate corrinoid/iron sulfur protein methyltransferase